LSSITITGTAFQKCLKASRIVVSKQSKDKAHFIIESRDNSVGIALGYGLDDRGSGIRFPAGAGNISLSHRVQNGSGAHPVSYPMGTRDFHWG
jgi:hypothetical protein